MSQEKFATVKCADCGNEQTIFMKPSTKIQCQVCSATIATPTGGKAIIKSAPPGEA